jgi:hypothetical protein
MVVMVMGQQDLVQPPAAPRSARHRIGAASGASNSAVLADAASCSR